MNPRFILLLALLVRTGVVAAEPKATPAPASPAPTSVAAPATAPARPAGKALVEATPRNDSSIAPSAAFDGFRIVADRNIFNPNRTGARRERTTEDAPPRLDSLALVGTMDSDKGLRAFFDGSDRAYRKTVRIGESIAGFKVTQIRPEGVDLEFAGKAYAMRVGQQFRKPDGGEWNLIGADVVRQEAQTRAAASAGVDPSAPVAVPDNLSEIEKRMRERRNQTLKQ